MIMNEEIENRRFSLVGEPNTAYFVYPSWAQLSYRWEDLPKLMADPLAASYTDPHCGGYTKETKVEYWQNLGWPTENIEPARFIDGPGGGGIIVGPHVYRGRWLPGVILGKEANIPSPVLDITGLSGIAPFNVGYLEPYDRPLWNYFDGKKRKKLYICVAMPEHIESDPEGIYWVIVIKKSQRKIKGLESLPDWSKAFGIDITALPGMPNLLHEETSDWFKNPELEFLWYKVQGGGNGAGYHYAVALYMALHLRFVVGPRIKIIHLLANIEGKPRVRSNWPHR